MAGRRTWTRWAVRLTGLGLVAFVLLTQVRWSDALRTREGELLEGRVRAAPGGYAVEPRDGAARFVPEEGVARRELGGREAPDVVFGLPGLASRLAGRAGTATLVLLLLAGVVGLTAWRWERLVRVLGLALPLRTAFRLTWVGMFFNLAIPGSTGGDVVKAWYAARLLGAPTRAVVSVFVDRALGLFALVLLAGAALLLAPGDPAYARATRLVLLCLAGGILGGVLVLSRRVRRGLGLTALTRRLPFAGVLAETDAALRLYRGHPVGVGVALLLSLANHLGTVACAWLLVGALGFHDLGLLPVLVVVPLATLVAAVPLLPGGWGVGEAAYAWLLSPFGVAPTEAVALSVVLRLALLLVGLPGGLLWVLARGHPAPEEALSGVEGAVEELEVEALGAGRRPSPPPGSPG